jgi:molybdate transport system permease protein
LTDLWQVLFFTLRSALAGLLWAAPLGIALAWALAKRSWRGKAWVETLVAVPLVLPPVATGILLLKLLGRRGPLGAFFYEHGGWDLAFSPPAVSIAMGVMAFPMLVRAARVAFEEVPKRYEDLARTLGLDELRVLRRVTLPLAQRGLYSGILLGFARALGEFGATITLAGAIPGRTETVASAIYQRLQLGRDQEVLPFVLLSLAVAFGLIWAAEQWLKPAQGRSR